MANYSLVVDSRFTPFTYQEMLQPIMAAQTAHQEIEDQYTDLATKANIWEGMADEQNDPRAYSLYKSFADDLAAKADTLAREGLSASSRRDMLAMKSRYSKEIAPIEQAYTRRRELQNEQRQAMLKDPTLRFERNFNTRSYESSLDRFLEDNNYDYGRSYSGALLTQQVSQQAAALAKELRSTGEAGKQARARLQQLLPYQYRLLEERGFNSSEVLNAIMGDENASQVLTNIVDNALTASGVRDWADASKLQHFMSAANNGLWSAVGTDEYKYLKDDYNMQLGIHKATTTPPEIQDVAINPSNIYTQKELTEIRDNISKFGDYFKKNADGTYSITMKGIDEYRKKTDKSSGPVTAEAAYSSKGEIHSDFRKFMDSLGLNPDQAMIDNYDDRAIGSLWGKYLKEHDPETYDATKYTEHKYTIGDKDAEAWKNAILFAIKDSGQLDEVDFNKDTETFEPTGNSLSIEELNKKDYTVVADALSTFGKNGYGNTVFIKHGKGNIVRYKLPAGINITQEQNIRNSLMRANKYSEIINTGKIGDSHATAADLLDAERNYKKELSSAYLYNSQLPLQNITTPQSFNPFSN